jgi:hypothetical protein
MGTIRIRLSELKRIIREEVGGKQVVKVTDVQVGDTIVSSSGGPDVVVTSIEPGGRYSPGTLVFRFDGGSIQVGKTEPGGGGQPAVIGIRPRQ